MGSNMGNQKKGAYLAWVFALMGGLLVGMGLAIIFVSRAIIGQVLSVDSSLRVNFDAWGNIQLLGAFSILLGILSLILGLYYIGRYHRMVAPPPPS